MKNNKGITLVALVITIIVLLILAGVSISMVVGENGVLNRATNAADKTSEADVKSALENAIMGCQGSFIEEWEKNPNKDFLTWLEKENKGADKIKANLDATVYTVTYTGGANHEGTITKATGGATYTFQLEASGKIGAKIKGWTKSGS